MSLQEEYNNLESGIWCEFDPTICPCRGSGWLLSDLDIWHKCHAHNNKELGHPEKYDYCDEMPKEEYETYLKNSSIKWKNHYINLCKKAIEFYKNSTSEKAWSLLNSKLEAKYQKINYESFSDSMEIQSYFTDYFVMVRNFIESYNYQIRYDCWSLIKRNIEDIEECEKIIEDYEVYCENQIIQYELLK